MLTVARENTILFNDEYFQYRDSITNIEQRLQKDISLLDFESQDHDDAIEYSKDRVTLFRFLKDSGFLEDKAVERLLDTIQWRKEQGISRMTYQSIASEFFENPFAFFYKQDLLGRPIAVIQMRHFPKFREKNKSLSYFMQPFACLVMEIARQLTRDLTRKNEKDKITDKPVLISQISIVIDIASAPFVPVDSSLMQNLKAIVNTRFPGFIGSVYILNFGWMYQGIWQVVKLVLSDQAKARVSFCNNQEIKQVIQEDDLLKALGGNDTYEWSLDSDLILDLYASENRFKEIAPSPRLSRSSSVSSIDSSIFFDAPEYLSRHNSSQYELGLSSYTSMSPSVYGTPGTLTPIDSYLANRQNRLAPRPPSEPRYYLNGFHMGDSFLTSFFRMGQQPNNTALDSHELTNRLNQLIDENEGYLVLESGQGSIHFPHMLPDDHPQSIYMTSPVKHQLVRAEQRIIRLSRKLFHLSFSYHGAVYWVILYLFLRGPVETNLKKVLLKLMAGTTQQQIAYTTAGISATVAAALSASLSNSLQNNNHRQQHR